MKFHNVRHNWSVTSVEIYMLFFFPKIVEYRCSISTLNIYGQYVRNNARVYMVATLYFEGGAVSHKASWINLVPLFNYMLEIGRFSDFKFKGVRAFSLDFRTFRSFYIYHYEQKINMSTCINLHGSCLCRQLIE